jgi:hypothetical protein
MIDLILKLLALDPHFARTEYIEIAKGKNELPTTFKKGLHQIKRQLKWQRRK